MTNRALFSILLVMLAYTFSCKKDEKVSPKASFSAKVDGTLWTGSIMKADHDLYYDVTSVFAVGNSLNDQLVMNFKGSDTGTYFMYYPNVSSIIIDDKSYTSLNNHSSFGQIVITRYDAAKKLISGTFYFDGVEYYGKVCHVTEGKFENVALRTY